MQLGPPSRVILSLKCYSDHRLDLILHFKVLSGPPSKSDLQLEIDAGPPSMSDLQPEIDAGPPSMNDFQPEIDAGPKMRELYASTA